jgi:hypothetical protein
MLLTTLLSKAKGPNLLAVAFNKYYCVISKLRVSYCSWCVMEVILL